MSGHPGVTGAAEAAVDVVHRWRPRHEVLAARWQVIETAEQAEEMALVAQWQNRLEEMRARQQDVVQSGRWRGGPRTLLAALDLHYRELAMTAGLAWLLRPDGHHGLGPAVLSGLLAHLELHGSVIGPDVRIVLEEQRDQTRADLVVYGGGWTIVMEAKTFAVEQERQLDRLYEHWWNEPDPCFVFLTRGQRLPITAVTSQGRWRALTWQQVADITRLAATSMTETAPGVLDYITTLEAYHRV